MQLYAVRMGSGEPPLLLVHGFTGSSLDFAEVMPALATKRRVIAFDHRGHGDSPNTGDLATYTIDQLVADMETFVDAEGLTSFHLLGHSMGGVVVQRYVLAHPERVRSLILMDTMPAPSLAIPKGWVESVVARGRAEGMGAIAQTMAELARNQVPPPREEIIANTKVKLEQMDPEAFGGLADCLTTFESMVDRLGGITCPTTIIVGANDTPFREPSATMHEAIPNSTLVVVDDAGHCPQEDQLDEWLAAVERHLDAAA
jgi:pimeloyl-ACP methyl ester carboxylesterase